MSRTSIGLILEPRLHPIAHPPIADLGIVVPAGIVAVAADAQEAVAGRAVAVADEAAGRAVTAAAVAGDPVVVVAAAVAAVAVGDTKHSSLRYEGRGKSRPFLLKQPSLIVLRPYIGLHTSSPPALKFLQYLPGFSLRCTMYFPNTEFPPNIQ